MNTNTGEVYFKEEDIKAAKLRGEPLVPISEQAGLRIAAGNELLNRHERRRRAKLAKVKA